MIPVLWWNSETLPVVDIDRATHLVRVSVIEKTGGFLWVYFVCKDFHRESSARCDFRRPKMRGVPNTTGIASTRPKRYSVTHLPLVCNNGTAAKQNWAASPIAPGTDK